MILVNTYSSIADAKEEELGFKYIKDGKYEEAVKWFKEAISLNPKTSVNYTGLGEAYKGKDNDEEATKWFKEAIRLDPHSGSSYAGIGRIFSKKGDHREAIKWFKKGIAVDPKNSENYHGLGWACLELDYYLDVDNHEEAIKWFKEAVKVNPYDSINYVELGALYRQAGKYSEALKWLDKAKELCVDKGCKYADEQLGRLYMGMGQYEKAEKILTSIVDGKDIQSFGYWGCPFQALGELYSHMSINSQKRKVLENYIKAADIEREVSHTQFETARICYEYGDYENAMRYIERAFYCRDGYKELNKYQLLKGFILVNMKRYNEAEQIFNTVLNSGSGIEALIAKVGIGHIEITRNNYTLAKKYFQEMLKVERADPMANLGMAWINSNQNNHEEALLYYEAIGESGFSRMLGLRPPQILILLGEGNALMGLKRIEEAKKTFERVLMIDPQNEYALAELGIVLYNKQDDKHAEEFFKESLKVNKTSYTCPYEGLGLLYLRAGKTKEAEENFKKAIEMNPNIEYKKYNGLAKIYLKKGMYKEAKELLVKSIKNYPYDNEAQELLRQLEKGINDNGLKSEKN